MDNERQNFSGRVDGACYSITIYHLMENKIRHFGHKWLETRTVVYWNPLSQFLPRRTERPNLHAVPT
jgi:hypothetical protein